MVTETWYKGRAAVLMADINRCRKCPDDYKCPIVKFRTNVVQIARSNFGMVIPNEAARNTGLVLTREYFTDAPGKEGPHAVYKCSEKGEGSVDIYMAEPE